VLLLQAADAIKAMLSPTATVVRNGQRDTIDADLLVPGDVVVIKSGDKVPADLRLLECSNLQVRKGMHIKSEMGFCMWWVC
jgi:P-type E1-E2 ATPase